MVLRRTSGWARLASWETSNRRRQIQEVFLDLALELVDVVPFRKTLSDQLLLPGSEYQGRLGVAAAVPLPLELHLLAGPLLLLPEHKSSCETASVLAGKGSRSTMCSSNSRRSPPSHTRRTIVSSLCPRWHVACRSPPASWCPSSPSASPPPWTGASPSAPGRRCASPPRAPADASTASSPIPSAVL